MLDGKTAFELELSFEVSSSMRPSVSPVSGAAMIQVLWSDGIVGSCDEDAESDEQTGEDGEQAKSVGDGPI